MNRLKASVRTQVLNCLIEGCSIRATVRMTGVSKKTVMRLLVEVGVVCADYQNRVLRNLTSRRLQVDEMWGFNYCKARNVTSKIATKHPMAGDVWLWVALDADTKLVPAWRVGDRDLATAYDFMHDLADRLTNQVQLTTDGHRPYLEAVESAFGVDIDYAMLIKIYGSDQTEKRYSPAKCLGCDARTITGQPNPKHINTSFIERQKLERPNCHETLHEAEQRFQPQDREPLCSGRLELLRVQFHQDSPNRADESGDGSGSHGPAVGSVGSGGATRNLGVQKSGLAESSPLPAGGGRSPRAPAAAASAPTPVAPTPAPFTLLD